MQSVIVNDYSLFNSYLYPEKGVVIDCADRLSKPLRTLFGGHNVTVIDQIYEQVSTCDKIIAYLAISILPLTLIAFGVKALCSYIWSEYQEVEQCSLLAVKKIHEFVCQKPNGEYELANIYFHENDDGDAPVFFTDKARPHSLYEEVYAQEYVQEAVNHLKCDNISAYVASAVKQRLNREFASEVYALSSAEIFGFVNDQCIGKDNSAKLACYEEILKDVLFINLDVEPPCQQAIKLVLMSDIVNMVRSLKFLKESDASVSVQLNLIGRNESIESCRAIFSNTSQMKILRNLVCDIRRIFQSLSSLRSSAYKGHEEICVSLSFLSKTLAEIRWDQTLSYLKTTLVNEVDEIKTYLNKNSPEEIFYNKNSILNKENDSKRIIAKGMDFNKSEMTPSRSGNAFKILSDAVLKKKNSLLINVISPSVMGLMSTLAASYK